MPLFSFGVVVTCKDTCGVADVVGPRWITSPEIDQPFVFLAPITPCIPIYLLYVSHCLTVSDYGLFFFFFLLSNKMDYTKRWLRLCGIMDLYQRSLPSYVFQGLNVVLQVCVVNAEGDKRNSFVNLTQNAPLYLRHRQYKHVLFIHAVHSL